MLINEGDVEAYQASEASGPEPDILVLFVGVKSPHLPALRLLQERDSPRCDVYVTPGPPRVITGSTSPALLTGWLLRVENVLATAAAQFSAGSRRGQLLCAIPITSANLGPDVVPSVARLIEGSAYRHLRTARVSSCVQDRALDPIFDALGVTLRRVDITGWLASVESEAREVTDGR